MASRKISPLPTRVWRFPAKFVTPLADVQEILWRGNRYYNRLVEIEHARYERFVSIRREYAPALAALEDDWAAADAAIVELYAEVKRDRAAHWRESGEARRSLPPEFEARKAVLVAQRDAIGASAKTLRSDFVALLEPARAEYKRRTTERCAGRGPRTKSLVNAEVRAEMAHEPSWHPAWKAIDCSDIVAHEQAIEARASCGLHGGTYQGVEEAFGRAKTDSAPMPPRFRRFAGEGLIRVQPKDATWASLGSARRVTVESIESRTGSRRSNIRRVVLDQSRDDVPSHVEATCRLHRLPPDDALIKWIAFAIRRVGREVRCELQLTLEHASFAEPKRPSGARSPEHLMLGWSKQNDGGIRVAHWPGGSVSCPPKVLDGYQHAESIGAARDRIRNEGLRRIRAILVLSGNRPDVRSLQRMAGRSIEWTRRMAEDYARSTLGDEAVHQRWRTWIQERRARGEDLYAPMRVLRATMPAREAFAWWCWTWARKHAHLEQMAVHVRRKAIRRRDALYRAEAIRLATEFASLTVDKYSVASLKQLEPLSMPNDGTRAVAQWQAQVAAPGRFREILQEVMGDRCSPGERPGGTQATGSARARKTVRSRAATGSAMNETPVGRGVRS